MTLRLIDLEAPLEDVEFPNGSVHKPIPFGPTHYAKWREVQESKDSDERWLKLVQIAKDCYPTANVYDWDSITSATMLIALVGHAGGRIDRVKEALKNAEALAAKTKEEKKDPPEDEPPAPTTANITQHLSPKTSGALSVPISLEPSEETSGTTTGPVDTIVPS